MPVDSLHHAVALGMVGGGGNVLDPQLLAGRGPDGRGELASPVQGDDGGEAWGASWGASMQVLVSMVAKGMASSHLLDWSMMVKRYR